MIKHIARAFFPLLLASLILSSTFILPQNAAIVPSSISPDMPLGYRLPGWHGIKTQESDKERQILAHDTKFSKAIYKQLPRVPWEKPSPQFNISIVYSGKSLNGSIHRPEVCLPAQGHMSLQGEVSQINLNNGKTLKFTRLKSKLPTDKLPSKRLNFIHYYIFIGHNTICHTHLWRNIQDIIDRCIHGRIQSWAYFQAGTYWSPELGITEEEADKRLRTLISDLLPRQIDWKALER